jgi:hypothetical protein
MAKTAKQAMLVLSSIQPDAVRRKKGRSKPDRVLRQAPRVLAVISDTLRGSDRLDRAQSVLFALRSL